MNALLRIITLEESQAELNLSEAEQALLRTCKYVSQFWSNLLRLNLFKTDMQTFAQELAAQTNPLSHELIDRFQRALEHYLFRELIQLEDVDPKQIEPDFERWVGCFEYGPNTKLAEVAESFSISPLHFPPQTGCYVYPGLILGITGKVRQIDR